ncbi:nuclear transport factor 2 family protein [Saccharopolyspora sp. K220]|uniref:nuclear transport factor 2 family protein n=1 Tax=Saccharopolyspora soli TaxID=2926618 RepID=UPI001F5AC6CA|nr:nuclear transport factor 2 family protein [Saccharopolyspora soli]MCI2421705.1 nuclear transport factor 2 family protein [Saccharopolyspora soli]
MSIDNDTLVREFVAAFNTRDTDHLADYLHPDVVFRNYGEDEVHGRDALLRVWKQVFANFEQVEFETVHQAVNGDVVIAEQIHGLALPGRPLAPVMNMAVYEIRDGKIAAWRDYTNVAYAAQLVTG